jgi:hypothetical protein
MWHVLFTSRPAQEIIEFDIPYRPETPLPAIGNLIRVPTKLLASRRMTGVVTQVSLDYINEVILVAFVWQSPV